MRLAVRSALGFALLATLTMACSGTPAGSAGASSSASRPSREVCSLLTAEDIQSVLGIAPGASKLEKVQCIWPAADGSNEFLVQLIVTETMVRSYDELARNYREELDTDPATAIHPIPGVGQFAVGFKEMAMVQIYTGSTMVQVSTFEHREQHALDLAKRAVARLK
jgi:hypothetical protein